MTFYPVSIPTLNRYEHFKACVESLARCTYADKTELVRFQITKIKDVRFW